MYNWNWSHWRSRGAHAFIKLIFYFTCRNDRPYRTIAQHFFVRFFWTWGSLKIWIVNMFRHRIQIRINEIVFDTSFHELMTYFNLIIISSLRIVRLPEITFCHLNIHSYFGWYYITATHRITFTATITILY